MRTSTQSDFAQAAPFDVAVSRAYARLERVLAAVKRPGELESDFDNALAALAVLSKKEGIPIAIIGGLGAIKYGYDRNTKDIDVVVGQRHLYTITQVAPNHGIKLVWSDPSGWHKFQHDNLMIEVIPEGGQPRKNSPTTIPSPTHLGVSAGLEYASLEGWIETKLASARQQDKADVVQVVKKTSVEDVDRVRRHLEGVSGSYLRQFEELVTAAAEEIEQEETRGGRR